MTPLRHSLPAAWAAISRSMSALEAAAIGTDAKAFAKPGCGTCHGEGMSTAEVAINRKGCSGTGNRITSACHCVQRRRARAARAFWREDAQSKEPSATVNATNKEGDSQ